MKYDKLKLFWKSKLSQWHICFFIVDGITYNCGEQYMMAEKARLFNDGETRDKILASSDPKEQKALGRKVKNFSQEIWDRNARNIVHKGNMERFQQNKYLRDLLFDTAGHLLVEASPYDPVWGIGLNAKDPRALDPKQWKGKNWLGEILTNVRDMLTVLVQKIAVFGGSFDPPHVGHLWAIAYTLAMHDVKDIWIIPCYKHVYGKELTPFEHRFEMCKKMFDMFPRVKVSDLEKSLSQDNGDKPNFTADTLEYLNRSYGYESSLIVGEDIAKNIHKWDGYERITKVANILPVPREDKAIPELGSTNIKEEIKKGRMPDKILTPKVLDYIVQNNLYGAK